MTTYPTDKDAYNKWYHKYLEETNMSHDQTQLEYINKLKGERGLLNHLENIPQPQAQESMKICTPEYMRTSDQGGLIPNLPYDPTTRNKHDLYTLDGYPRKNFLYFYEQPNVSASTNNLQQTITKNNASEKRHAPVQREATDVTNYSLYDKMDNPAYDEYLGKQKEFLNFNKDTASDNVRYKGYLQAEKKRINDERIDEMNRLRRLEQEAKVYENEKKRIYKNLLDDQIKVKVPSKLGIEYYNPNLNDNAIKYFNPQLYITTPEHSFMNRNKLVEVNPCNY